MKSVIQKVKDWFGYKKPEPAFADDFFYKNVLRFDKGKLYRGHEGSLVVSKDNIALTSKFYNCTTTQRYSIRDNKLYISFHMHRNYAKWFAPYFNHAHKLYESRCMIAKLNGYSINYRDNRNQERNVVGNLQYEFVYMPTVTFNLTFDNLDGFMNSYDIIAINRNLRGVMSKATSRLKEMGEEMFANNLCAMNPPHQDGSTLIHKKGEILKLHTSLLL
jgi:hypothetical protein